MSTKPDRLVTYQPWVTTYADGSQLLVSVYDGHQLDTGEEVRVVTAATRRDRWATWGAPIELERPQ